MADRLPVIGFIGPRQKGGLRAKWHAWAIEAGIPQISVDAYRADICTCPRCTKHTCLLLRLSEMYTLGRTGYAIDAVLSVHAFRLIDAPAGEVLAAGKVDTVVNIGGVLHGTVLDTGGAGERELFTKRLQYWGLA